MSVLTETLSHVDLGIGRLLTNIGRVFGSIAAAQDAAAEYERMNNRTDAELAAKGLHRSDVSRAIFELHFK
jgi:hypothetical protein